jgi:hypothetical protein
MLLFRDGDKEKTCLLAQMHAMFEVKTVIQFHQWINGSLRFEVKTVKRNPITQVKLTQKEAA